MKFTDRVKSAFEAFRWGPEQVPTRYGSHFFFPILQSTSNKNSIDPLMAFYDVPELSAVINTKARMFSRMSLRLVSRATGEDAKNYENIIKVLRNPNWFQSQREFLRQTKLFREIFGREYIFSNFPYGTGLTQVRSMYALPPHLVTVKTTDPRPFMFYDEPEIEYWFQWGNDKHKLENENILHLNDNRVNVTKDNWADGESMTVALSQAINNIEAAYEARNVIIENRGALGILSNAGKDVAGTLPLDPKEKEHLQEQLKGYGLSKNKAQWIITNLALQWQQISVDDANKLGLFPECEADFQKICDSYGVDRQMFATVGGTTFENKKWGERATWENTIIPEAQEWIDALNYAFGTVGKSWHIVGTFDHIGVLQENLKERAQAIALVSAPLATHYQNGAITLDEYQQELRRYGIKEAVK